MALEHLVVADKVAVGVARKAEEETRVAAEMVAAMTEVAPVEMVGPMAATRAAQMAEEEGATEEAGSVVEEELTAVVEEPMATVVEATD